MCICLYSLHSTFIAPVQILHNPAVKHGPHLNVNFIFILHVYKHNREQMLRSNAKTATRKCSHLLEL